MSPVRSSAAKTLLDINAASESVPKNSRRPKPSCPTSIACPPRIDSTATSLHAEPVVIGVAVFAAGGGAHREQAHFRADPAAGTRGKGLADRAEVRAVGARPVSVTDCDPWLVLRDVRHGRGRWL